MIRERISGVPMLSFNGAGLEENPRPHVSNTLTWLSAAVVEYGIEHEHIHTSNNNSAMM